MDTPKREIAAVAARLVVEEGLEYGPAKRRALREMGLNARTALPHNDEVEAEVRDYIQLFCDDSKSAEIALIDHHVDYEPRMVTGFHGEKVEALSVHAPSRLLGEEIGVHLLVYDFDDLR